MAKIPEIKIYRLNKLGNPSLTVAQKNQVANNCNCSIEYVEMCLSPNYPCINYHLFRETAKVIGKEAEYNA